ncbi:MAG: hypothetical protein II574_05825 [Ruminococcus sp.]|nr:hypothetical protein [Ruminococcus sp.]
MSPSVSVTTTGKWETETHKATDVRLYSADSEKIFLEFKPVREQNGKELQWVDWNCYDSVFVYQTDYNKLLVPALEKLFPLQDPDPLGWGMQDCFDATSMNWLGADKWNEYISALEQSRETLNKEEQMFIDTLLPMFRSFTEKSGIICVEGNL